MAAIVAFLNTKGGVGKTTLAVNVAAALVTGRRKVRVVDADSQASATAWSGLGELPVPVDTVPLEGDSRRAIEAWLQHVLRLSDDVVVVDGPPHLNAAAGAIAGVADVVVIPAKASPFDIDAAGATVALVREARRARGDGRPRCLLVPSMIDARTAAAREIGAALAELGEPVAPEIHVRAAHADAVAAGQTIEQFAPRSPAADEVAALAARILKETR